MTPAEAAAIAWASGDAALMRLTPVQQDIRDAREQVWQRSRLCVELASRRLGKSHEFVCDADAWARAHDRQIIKYAAATGVSVRDFILPIFFQVLRDCPEHLLPVWHVTDGQWVYPNGSTITIVGCDDKRKADHLRGPACDRAYIDEAAFIPILDYVVQSVVMPMFVTRPNGRVVLGSSAPESPAHPFAAYVKAAQDEGVLICKTIYDATHIADATIAEFCREAGGEHSTTWRREYLCEIVVDEARAVLPEMATAARDVFVDEPVTPKHRDLYVGWDTGHKDLTVGAFGYLDYGHDRLVVEAEAVVERATVADIVQMGLDMERVLWAGVTPRARTADAPPLVLAEMAAQGYGCIAAGKAAEASLGRLRDVLRDRKLHVSSACPTIREHMVSAVWAVNGSDYERRPRRGNKPAHHFDGVDAVRYMLDPVDWYRDPTPPPDPRLGGGWGLMAERSRSLPGMGSLTLSPRRALTARARGK